MHDCRMLALALLCLLGGCRGEDVDALVRSHKIEEAFERAVSQEDGVWRTRLAHWRSVDSSRRVLQEWEGARAVTACRKALAAEQWAEAFQWYLAIHDSPNDIVEHITMRAHSLAKEGNYTGTVEVARYLKQGGNSTALNRADVQRWQVLGRYEPLRLAQTLNAQQGLRRSMLSSVLQLLQTHYYRPVSLAGVVKRVQERMAVLEGLSIEPGRSLTFGQLFPKIPSSESLDWAVVDSFLQACIQAGVEAGYTERLLVYEFTDALLTGLDAWTTVIWPAEMGGWHAHTEGVRLGVGLPLQQEDSRVVTGLPVYRSPAFQAGVYRGEQVLQLRNGTHIVRATHPIDAPLRMQLDEALQGPENSTVEVSLLRDGQERSVILKRVPVPGEWLRGFQRQPTNDWSYQVPGFPGVAYIRIVSFRPDTGLLLRRVFEEMNPKPTRVLLDLRGNTGGDLTAATEVLELFIADGIVGQLLGPGAPPAPGLSEEGEPLLPWNAAVQGDLLEGVPLAVLIDGETASSAELVAGSLRQRAGAVLFGTPTFGKGLSQRLISATDGFAMQISNTWWALPDGQVLYSDDPNRTGGILPDIPIALGSAAGLQLELLRHKREALRQYGDGQPIQYASPMVLEEVPVLSGDPAMERALLYVAALAVQ